ncbi:MAG: ATP-binding protein [Holophagaceae bacterium]
MLRLPFLRLCLAALLCAPPLPGQGRGARAVQAYGPEEGLANPEVLAIAEDPAGFIWFATAGGLFRFEGRRFRRAGAAEGLEGVSARALAAGRGALVVGTSRGVFRGGGGEGFSPLSGPREAVWALALERDGSLWAAGKEGLFRSGPGGSALVRVPGWQGPGPAVLTPAQGGGVWTLDAAGGIQGLRWTRGLLDAQPLGRPRGLPPGEAIESLLEDASGRLYARSRSFLGRRGAEGAWEDLSARVPLGGASGPLHLDRSGRLWVPTATGPVAVLADRFWAPRLDLGPSAPPCRLVHVDREGTLWLAGEGLHRVLGRGLWEAFRLGEGLPATATRAVLRDAGGRLYAGTDRGLAVASSIGWSAVRGTEGLRVLSLAEGARARIYAAGSPAREVAVLEAGRPGLALWPLRGGALQDRAVLAVAEAREGLLWLGTDGSGLLSARRSPSGLEAERVRLPDGPAEEAFPALLRDRQGRLWAAGSAGLLCLEAGAWRRFGSQNGLPASPPKCLAQGGGDDVWAGFEDGSVLRLRNLEGVLRVVGRVAGLGAPPRSLAEGAGGVLWIGTAQGLYRFDGRGLEAYTRRDGLPADACAPSALLAEPGGDVWVATAGGLARFEGSAAPLPDEAPRAVLVGLAFGGTPQRLSGAGMPRLAPGQDSLEAEATALAFSRAHALAFQSRLLGHEEAWREAPGGRVSYPRLPPGTYRLDLRASLQGGPAPDRWGEPLQVWFSIRPPWWRSPWVGLLGVAGLAGAVYALYRWRTRALHGRNTELAREVRRQTEALRQAVRTAQAADEAKGEFLATMSHELRTPLNAILGMSGILLESNLAPQQRESARTIQGASRALLAIINDLLDFARLEEGRLRLHAVPFDFSEILEETLDLLSPQAEEKGIELVLRIQPGMDRRFMGDPDRIRQVVLNLLGNALKFTERGHVLVALECMRVSGDLREVQVSIEDTGIGISEDKQARLFERFSQADSGITRRYGGTGLGLAISRKLVELMGGRIGLQSRVGIGSWFWFTLELPADPQAPAPPPPPCWPDFPVLLVTPREVSAKALAELLESWQVPCARASAVEEAVAMLEAARNDRRPFHAALLDASLAGDPLDAAALAQEVRALLVMAPMHGSLDGADWRTLGAEGVLRKPIYDWALREVLEPVREAILEGRPVLWLGGDEGEAEPGPARPLAGRRVLLAEDNELNQRVAVHMLESMGADVVVAADGKEAIARSLESRFDLMLMDAQMPELDGYSATIAIRTMEQGLRRTPILALTAHAMEGEEARARAAGMDGLLTKPIEKPDLLRALQPLMEAAPAPVEAVDRAALARLGAGAREVVELFLQHAPSRVRDLRQGLEDRESEPLRQAAHALNGMSAYLYARELCRLCAGIEEAAAAGRFKEAEALIARAEGEYERVVADLRSRTGP